MARDLFFGVACDLSPTPGLAGSMTGRIYVLEIPGGYTYLVLGD
jgi:hypothetical protein